MKKMIPMCIAAVCFCAPFSGPLFALPSMVGTWQCDKGGRLTFGANGTLVADGMGVTLSGTYSLTNRGYVFTVLGKPHEDIISRWDANSFERYPMETPSFRDTCRRVSDASCPATIKCLSGNCVNGYGKEDLGDGDWFEGTFVGCDWHGNGVFVTTNGTIRVAGVFKTRGKFPDRVIVTDTEHGSRYEGALVNGKFAGLGVITYSKDFKNEDGTSTLKGTRVECNWVDGKMSGPCKMTSPDGAGYDGEMRDNAKNGFGTQRYPDGSTYSGSWVNGHRSGKGTAIWKGGRYEGNWLDDNYFGRGVLTLDNGNRFEGTWQSGEIVGSASIRYASGDTYQGGITLLANEIEARPSGQGTYIWKDGRRYVGMWKDGKRHGQGTQYKSDASIEAQGEFIDDQPPARP